LVSEFVAQRVLAFQSHFDAARKEVLAVACNHDSGEDIGASLMDEALDEILPMLWCLLLALLPLAGTATVALAARPDVMGGFVVSTRLRILDWIATGVMALAVLGMEITTLL
jgi:hypothetical protein